MSQKLNVNHFEVQVILGEVDCEAPVLQVRAVPLEFELSDDSRRQHFDFKLCKSSTDAHSRPKAERQIRERMSILGVWALGVVSALQPALGYELLALLELALVE